MPTVPRNSQTDTRIDRIPGVQNVQPHGAEDMSAQIGALGRQAGAIDEKIQSIGAQGRAIQNVFGATADAAISVDRVQRLRDLRDVDATENEVFNSLKTKMDGQDDPQTGTRIPGTLEAKYDPEGKDGEKSSAVIATSKAYAEIISDKNGSFSKLSPRAQELFRLRFTHQYRAFEAKAQEKDDNNRQIRVKAIDMAASKRNADLLDQNITNEPAWLGNLPLATQSEAMRQFRYGMVDPTVSNEADIQWRDKSIQPLYEQAKKDIASKYAYGRSLGLLQMADAVPIGSPDADVKAGQLIDEAQAFAKKSALTPEQIAKTQELAQAAREKRTQRTHEQYGIDLKTASYELYKFKMGFSKSPADYEAARKKLKEPDAAKIDEDAYQAVAADDVRSAARLIDSYIVDGDKAKFDDGVKGLRTVEGKARIITWNARREDAKDKKEYALNEVARGMASNITVSRLKAGFTQDEKGNVIQLEPWQIRSRLDEAMIGNQIDDKQYDSVLESLKSRTSAKAVESANGMFDAASDALGLSDKSEIRKWYAYNGKQDRFNPVMVTGKNGEEKPFVSPSSVPDDDDIEASQITVAMIGDALNTINAYYNAPHKAAKDKDGNEVGPLTPYELAKEIFKADKNGHIKRLDEITMSKRIRRVEAMTINAYKIQAKAMDESKIGGAGKRLDVLRNKPTSYDTGDTQEQN